MVDSDPSVRIDEIILKARGVLQNFDCFLMLSLDSWNIGGLNQVPNKGRLKRVRNNLRGYAILESHVDALNLKKIYDNVFGNWKLSSNQRPCITGMRIVLGWNPNTVLLLFT